MAKVSAGPADGEDASLRALQQHLQLEAHEGKYLTKQEILLLALFAPLSPVRRSVVSRSFSRSLTLFLAL